MKKNNKVEEVRQHETEALDELRQEAEKTSRKFNNKSKRHFKRGNFPNRTWPTDSENKGQKGPKI